jgi:hypothetical protein
MQEPRSFIVSRDVPNNPSFAIQSNDISLGNIIEEMIVEFGIKLYVKPSTIETKTEKSKNDNIKTDNEKITQSFEALDTHADYVILASGNRFKIIKVKDREIISTFTYNSTSPTTNAPKGVEIGRFKATFHDAFKKIGLKVKDYYWDYESAIWYLKAKKVEIKDVDGWKEYCKSDGKPFYIPSNPDNIYKNYGWESWDQWIKSINPQNTQVK